MTEAEEGSSIFATAREPLALPKWLPPSVEKEVRQIEGRNLPAEQCAIVRRLATDERMRRVWTELLRRSRSNSQFVNAAKRSREMPSLTQDEVQAKALREIFHFAFCASRDKLMVSKPEDVAREKDKLIEKALILRELAEMVEVSSFTIERAIPDAVSRQLAIADAAALVRVANRLEHVAAAMRPPSDPLMVQHHRGDPVVRLYTGTRHAAICSAAFNPAIGRGHIDLDTGVFYRRRQGSQQTNKRQSPVRLPARLLAHLKRWKRLGIARHAVVEWNGKPVGSVRKSFAAAAIAAGINRHITPHILRHTAATWAMQSGSDAWDAAGYLGMSPEVLERVYGHHHPDFQRDVAERMSGQNRDRNTVNKRASVAMNATKNVNNSRGIK